MGSICAGTLLRILAGILAALRVSQTAPGLGTDRCIDWAMPFSIRLSRSLRLIYVVLDFRHVLIFLVEYATEIEMTNV